MDVGLTFNSYCYVFGARPTTLRRDERCKDHIVAMGWFAVCGQSEFHRGPVEQIPKMFGLHLEQSETLLAKGFFSTLVSHA